MKIIALASLSNLAKRFEWFFRLGGTVDLMGLLSIRLEVDSTHGTGVGRINYRFAIL